MIFINRKRITKTKKDPANYWYVEKYVYGVLKETVKTPLKNSIQFTAIDSGYDDDFFAGWSIGGTSTAITFNAASYSYASVKGYLDSENTIKLYAVYSYHPEVSTYSASNQGNYVLICKEDQSVTFKGQIHYEKWVFQPPGSLVEHISEWQSISIAITDSTDKAKESFSVKCPITDGGITRNINSGDKIRFSVPYAGGPPSTSSGPPSGEYTQRVSVIQINSNGYLWDMQSSKYRVESHN